MEAGNNLLLQFPHIRPFSMGYSDHKVTRFLKRRFYDVKLERRPILGTLYKISKSHWGTRSIVFFIWASGYPGIGRPVPVEKFRFFRFNRKICGWFRAVTPVFSGYPAAVEQENHVPIPVYTSIRGLPIKITIIKQLRPFLDGFYVHYYVFFSKLLKKVFFKADVGDSSFIIIN